MGPKTLHQSILVSTRMTCASPRVHGKPLSHAREMHAVSLHGLGDLLLQIEALEKQRLRVVMSMYVCKMIVRLMMITMIDNG